MDIETFVRRLNWPEYETLKRAIELGKWPDGRRLAADERELLMSALIAWESRHLPEEQRTGHIERPDCEHAPEEHGDTAPLKWMH